MNEMQKLHNGAISEENDDSTIVRCILHMHIISSKIQVITFTQIYTSVNVDIELKDSPFPYLSMH